MGIQSARSLEKVLTAQLGKVNPTHSGHLHLISSEEGIITVLGPKGLRQECQSFIYFLNSVEFGVKKKNPKLLYKGMDKQAGLNFSVAQEFHLNDDE